ncbi:MAG TPA: hypothetical protein VHE32_03350 [Rhodanobacteraceae bacterium]|nr:hypothetical protein [Rhodanobacteraceae bacterium]
MKPLNVLVFVLALTPLVAYAADREVVKADTKAAFDKVAADVRTEMTGDGRYTYVKPDERAKVEAALDEMSRLFEANGSVDRMDKATQVKLFNAQESINAILTLRDRDRLVCERAAQPGSRIVGTTCRRYGDLEAARQSSEKFMNERAVTPCNAPSCTGH